MIGMGMMTDHHTTLPGVPRKSDAVPGMAHFKGTGPASTICGTCVDFRSGKDINEMSDKRGKCRAYKKFMGKWGPAFDRLEPSCKHYKAKE